MENLIEETLQSCREYIGKLLAAHEQLATYFQANQEARGLDLFKQYVEGIDWLQQAIRGIQNVEKDRIPGIRVDELNPQLLAMEEALRNRDFILLGDLLDFEVSPILEDWLSKIEEAV